MHHCDASASEKQKLGQTDRQTVRETDSEGDRQWERQRGRVKTGKILSNSARKRTPEGKRGKK